MQPIYEYTNYRDYLADYYAWAKKHVRGFSHRSFLQKAGMSGPNYLKRVMEGVHKLTDNSIPKFCQALGLGESEATYFTYLVYFNQAKSLSEKDKYFEILMTLKSPHSRHRLTQAQYNYYKDWYNIAIREILSYFQYQGDPASLGKEIAPPVSAKRVTHALQLLEELGLIEKNPEGGYVQTARNISTGPDIQSLLVPKFHLTMANLAREAITRFKKEDRYFSSVSMSLSRETYADIIELIREFRKKITERVSQDPEPDAAYHLNFQLFPLSKPKKKRRKK